MEANGKISLRRATVDPRTHVYEIYLRTMKQLQDKQRAKQKREHIARVEKEAEDEDTNALHFGRGTLQEKLRDYGDKYEKVNDVAGKHTKKLRSIIFAESTELVAQQENIYRKVLHATLKDEMDLPLATMDQIVDTAVSRIIPNTSQFLVWRVSEDGLEFLSKDTFSGCFEREVYVFYVCIETHMEANIHLRAHKIQRKLTEINIHIWIGKLASKQRTAYASVRAFEINTHVRNHAQVHRESQGSETPKFRSYFPKGLRIFTGYYRVVSNLFSERPALFHLKGRTRPTLQEMGTISWEHFNSDEVFFILTDHYLFIWFGSRASSMEKLNAIKIGEDLEKEATVQSVYFVDDGCEQALKGTELESFQTALSLENRRVEPYRNLNECLAQQIQPITVRLYICTPVKDLSNYKLTEYARPKFSSSILQKQHVYLLDQAPIRIWVWCGANLPKEEQSDTLRNARGFIKKKGYFNGTPISIIFGGDEPDEFRFLFNEWVHQEHSHRGRPQMEVMTITSDTLIDRTRLAAELQLIDSGDGKLGKYRVTKEESLMELIVKAPTDHYFFTEDCYVIVYHFESHEGEKNIIYYWMGKESSEEDQIATERLVEEKDRTQAFTSTIVKIVQGTEPPHFLQICQGMCTIYNGSGLDFDESGTNKSQPGKYFLQIFGSTTYSGKAVEVPMSPLCLNSNYLFKLKHREDYLWCGRFTSGDQREVAKEYMDDDFIMVYEGNEPPEFWQALGGKENYKEMHKVVKNNELIPPALFYCYQIKDTNIYEVIDFKNQTPFTPHSIILLDYFDVLYIWIGSKLSPQDRAFVKQLPEDYLSGDIKQRNINDVTLVTVKQNQEPVIFRGFFHRWDFHYIEELESYTMKRDRMELSSHLLMQCRYTDPENVKIMKTFMKYPKYTIKDLLRPAEDLKDTDIDLEHKECHLTIDDFYTVFDIQYHEFYKLPKWKQDSLKRQKGFF